MDSRRARAASQLTEASAASRAASRPAAPFSTPLRASTSSSSNSKIFALAARSAAKVLVESEDGAAAYWTS